MISRIIKSRWEKNSGHFAHLHPGKWHGTEENMFDVYRHNVLGHIDVSGKAVLDYGCGGGFLGKLLFKEFNIKNYIALDISERSLSFAYNNIIGSGAGDPAKIELYLVENDDFDFSGFYADIFISLACIQHFPTMQYLNKFLKALNNSKIPLLVLQIRAGDKVQFDEGCYEEDRDIRFACVVTKEHMAAQLVNYTLKIVQNNNKDDKYQYLFFELMK